MKVDHIGYAVKDIDKAKRSMEALGYIFEDTIEDTNRHVSIAFESLDHLRVELIAPCVRGGNPARFCSL